MKLSRPDRRGAATHPSIVRTATATHHRNIQDRVEHGDDALRSQDQWLDLIADLIVEDLRNEELRDADALRGVRPVQ